MPLDYETPRKRSRHQSSAVVIFWVVITLIPVLLLIGLLLMNWLERAFEA
jgi:hypothetical protein